MNKKSFWTGFLTGVFLTIITLFLVIRSFIIQPDVSLSKMKVEDLSGKQVNLSEMLGKPIVINYWATWCAPCRQEFPEFEIVKKRLGNKVTFLMISDETTKVIQRFKDKNSYSFNYLRATKGFEEVSARPTTFIYNSKGKLITKHTGGLNEKELMEMLNKIE
ncbi:TlpA family protein disulfide reductase [Pedobacter borealis]|uniref:TlpA family protein disulfide reductase n=1 Tax=Pedobacter borealis TaxID=475254 RepID=UPI0004935D5B|nr:TlpA disulfide reductase family protein [Pedobacter borealis]